MTTARTVTGFRVFLILRVPRLPLFMVTTRVSSSVRCTGIARTSGFSRLFLVHLSLFYWRGGEHRLLFHLAYDEEQRSR